MFVRAGLIRGSVVNLLFEMMVFVCLCLCVPQTRQPVFVQLLQGVFRVYHCTWLVPSQKGSVEACIKVLSDVGKTSSSNTHPPSHQIRSV